MIVEASAPGAKELATGIVSHIHNLLNEHKTYNYIFFGFYEIIPIILLSISFSQWMFCIAMKIDSQRNFWVFATAVSSVIILFWRLMMKFNPYCTFDSKINAARIKAIKWVLKGLLGVVLFGWIGKLLWK